MVEYPNKVPGIGGQERKFISQTEPIGIGPFRSQDSLLGDTGVRIRMPLPQGPSDVQAEKSSNDKVSPGNKGAVEDTTVVVKNIEPVKPAFPKTYVVTEGDNLALIATKFYGEEEGNKRANVMKIFEANRKLLKSPHEIQVGQNLIIPALEDSSSEEKKDKGILSSSLFERVVSIGREHLSSDKARQSEASKLYTVRDGDSLWRIASEQLGDGSRYTEVAKLNADVLSDEDSLTVGMSLKMPDK
jgi:nucleoid-associated protein YgaU